MLFVRPFLLSQNASHLGISYCRLVCAWIGVYALQLGGERIRPYASPVQMQERRKAGARPSAAPAADVVQMGGCCASAGLPRGRSPGAAPYASPSDRLSLTVVLMGAQKCQMKRQTRVHHVTHREQLLISHRARVLQMFVHQVAQPEARPLVGFYAGV